MNPAQHRTPPKDPHALTEFVRWVNRTARAYQESEGIVAGYGQPSQKQLLAWWQVHRPQMVRRLEQRQPGLTLKLAFVLENRMFEQEDEYRQAGMPWPDRREQAERDWLLREPEAEPED